MTEITGRDGYIMAKALAYAIVAIELRPERDQESSDQTDMRMLLEHAYPNESQRAHQIENARAHLTSTGWENPDGQSSGNVIPFPA